MDNKWTHYRIPRERVIEILGEYGYKSSGEFEDNYEIFKSNPPVTNTVYLGTTYIESEVYPIAYDYRFCGCENGLRAFIIGTYTGDSCDDSEMED